MTPPNPRTPAMPPPPDGSSNGATAQSAKQEPAPKPPQDGKDEAGKGDERQEPRLVDVDQRRYDVEEKILDRYAGDEDPTVLSDMPASYAEDLARYETVTQYWNERCGEDASFLYAHFHKLRKIHVNGGPVFEEASRNLTRPSEEKRSVLDRILGK